MRLEGKIVRALQIARILGDLGLLYIFTDLVDHVLLAGVQLVA